MVVWLIRFFVTHKNSTDDFFNTVSKPKHTTENRSNENLNKYAAGSGIDIGVGPRRKQQNEQQKGDNEPPARHDLKIA
jgi:hypothetical protein